MRFKIGVIITIVVGLVLTFKMPVVEARRIKKLNSPVKVLFVPPVDDVSGFWESDITLFAVMTPILGIDADKALICKWIEYQQQKAQETFEIIISLLDILTQVEEKDVRNGFLIEDLNGEIVNGIVNYFEKVCKFLGMEDISSVGHILVNEFLNKFFSYLLTPESRALIKNIYTNIFSHQQ